jgi:hypothetical protein
VKPGTLHEAATFFFVVSFKASSKAAMDFVAVTHLAPMTFFSLYSHGDQYTPKECLSRQASTAVNVLGFLGNMMLATKRGPLHTVLVFQIHLSQL